MVPNSANRLRLWEWTQTVLLGANLAWTTLCLGGYLASTMVVTASLTAALLLVHGAGLLLFGRAAGRADAESGLHPAAIYFVPFLLYAAANLAWVTPVAWLGWRDLFGWLQMVAVFWVVLNGVRSREARYALLGVLFAVATISVALGCYQRFVRPDWLMLGRTQADQYLTRASGSFGIPNSLAALLLLLLPPAAALALRRRAEATSRVVFGWLAAVLLVGLVLTISRGAWLGLATALMLWPLLAGRAPLARRVVLSFGIFAALLFAGSALYVFSPKVQDRLGSLILEAGERSRPVLWRAAWRMFRDEPVLGTGAGSFNLKFEPYRPEGFLNEPVWAHNDYLNTLSDYGLIGFLLFFGAAAAVVVRSGRRLSEPRGDEPSPSAATFRAPRVGRRNAFESPLVRQALGIGLLAFALQLLVDFHFKLASLAMAFATLAGLLVASRWPAPVLIPGERERRRVRLAGATAMILGGGVLVAIVPKYRAEAFRLSGRTAINRLADQREGAGLEPLARARDQLTRAVELDPGNANAWADLSYALAQQGRQPGADVAALGRDAEAAADRAIALVPFAAEYWVRRGVARDMQDRWYDAGKDFTQALSLSPNTVLPWYHYAYHLSLRPSGRRLAESMVAFCLRLDPRNAEALALRQRLATGPDWR